MSHTVIRIEGLGKRYRLGQRSSYRTLRDSLTDAAMSVARGLPMLAQRAGNSSANGRRGHDGHIWALRDVSLEVSQGEIVGFIGHNGAGKSTLLKILSRITYPTEGRVTLRGRLGSLLEVGTGFHPELTGRENVFLNGTILGLRHSEIKRKFDDIVEFSEVEEFLDTPVKRYSSGMHVRLAFAVAAHLEPDILIVDEVLAVGDAAFQKKCLGKMGDVAREGRTVLFVSHNMNAIQRLCPRAVLFEHGQIVADGSTQDIAGQYLSSGITSPPPCTWIDVSGVRRSGSGAVHVQELRYSSDDPNVRFQPYPSGPLDITLKIFSDEPRTINSIAVTLYDKNGMKLVNADTLSLGRGTELQRGDNLLRVHIDALYLNSGSYALGWWLANHPVEVFDFCESAIDLEVADSQNNQLGMRPSADGIVACRFEVSDCHALLQPRQAGRP